MFVNCYFLGAENFIGQNLFCCALLTSHCNIFILLLLQYPVSDFSHNLLERVRGEPLFNILDINGRILRKVQTLQRITLSRLQLRFSRPFLASCRLGAE